jgi:hypothetical protein
MVSTVCFICSLIQGAPQTLFHGKTLNALQAKYPSFEPTKRQSGNYWLKSPHLKISELSFEVDNLLVQTNLGNAEMDTSFTVFGSSGFDAIDGRKLILDIKNNLLTIATKDRANLNYTFHKIKGASLDRFPILFPAEIDGEQVQLNYVTGSMFTLIIDHQNYLTLIMQDPLIRYVASRIGVNPMSFTEENQIPI